MQSVNPAGKYQDIKLFGVIALSATSTWAVGTYGVQDPIDFGGRGQTLIEHWNGIRWVRVSSPSMPGPSSYSALESVTAGSSGDLMAAGVWICKDGLLPLALRQVSSGWRIVATPHVGNSRCPA